MKTMYVLAAAVCISSTAIAQNTPSQADLLITLQPQAKLIGITALGKVYAMPIDNMPCLVPNTADVSVMPTLQSQLFMQPMPNALPKENLIPNFVPQLKYLPNSNSNNLMLDLLRQNKKNH